MASRKHSDQIPRKLGAQKFKHMKKGNLLLVWLLLLLVSCQLKPNERLSIGLIHPVSLNPDSTLLYLEDYFWKPEDLLEIQLPDGLSYTLNKRNNTLLVLGNMSEPLAPAFFSDKYQKATVLLKRSEKQTVAFKLVDSLRKFKNVCLKASFNEWTMDSMRFDSLSNSWTIQKSLNKGNHQYLFVLDGKEHLDPKAKDSSSNGMGGYNSLLAIGNTNSQKPYINMEQSGEYWRIQSFQGKLTYHILQNNMYLGQFEGDSVDVTMLKFRSYPGRSWLRIFACNQNELSNDILLPLSNGKLIKDPQELTRADYHRMNMYFLMVDRFYDGDKSNNPTALDSVIQAVQFWGGDITGVTKKLEDGYFESLGINSLWLSPISRNPDGAYGLWDKGGVKTKFSAYHGYWPTSFSQIDPRFGTKNDLEQLISLSHLYKKNVVLDYVAHHIHTEHPLYKAKPDWTTSLYLPDSSLNTEKWDEHRLTTWFDVFLPTLDFTDTAVCEAVTDSALYWLRNFELDGFRHDATKHVHTDYWRMLTRKINTEILQRSKRNFYQIGETYGNHELIASYLGTGMLDGQFDFNLYDVALQTFAFDCDPASQSQNFKRLKASLEESLNTYGHHHLMGNISGNQDKPRFVSLADGSLDRAEDTKLAGYTRNIQNKNQEAFNRLALMIAFNYAIPGIPILYYGDEIGMPGANDPDNRRMMKFDNLNEGQQKLRGMVQSLSKMRNSQMPLLYGNTLVSQTDDYLLILRQYPGKDVAAIFTRKGYSGKIKWPENMTPKNWKTLLHSDRSSFNESKQEIACQEDSFIFLTR